MKFAIFSLMFLTACGDMKSQDQNPQFLNMAIDFKSCKEPAFSGTQRRIVSFGDSNTAGIMDLVNNCPYAYEYKIANDLQLNLVNLAVGGSRINMEGQLPTVLFTQFQPTDIVTFIAGYNDARTFGTNLNELNLFKEYLRDFISLTSSQTSLVMIGTTPQMAVYSPVTASAEAQAMYAQAVRSVVAELSLPNVVLVDVALINWQTSDFESDLVHFTPASQNRIAALFESQIP